MNSQELKVGDTVTLSPDAWPRKNPGPLLTFGVVKYAIRRGGYMNYGVAWRTGVRDQNGYHARELLRVKETCAQD